MRKQFRTKSRKQLLVAGTLSFIILFIAWTAWGNLTVGITFYHITNSKIPLSFNNYKIAQISDLHNKEFGKNNASLLKLLQKESPHIIVITGDLIDSSHTKIDVAVSFAKEAVKIAPCYYVTGNHEAWLADKYLLLEEQLKDCGVVILHNQMVVLEKNGEKIQLAGVDDPDFAPKEYMYDSSMGVIASEIESLGMKDGYKILLSHRPEVFETYVLEEIDLVLSGHAHGGQFRLPFIGGVIAPNQGFFPKYDGGVYTDTSTTMVVNRGLGNSIIPIRLNNRAEIVMIQLHNQ